MMESGRSGYVRMSRSWSKVASTLQMGMALIVPAFGQSLVEPERIPAERQLFEAASTAAQLRCDLNPVRPALTFGFRFQAGYTASVPLAQFRGSGHNLTVHTRVTPEGREPVYLTKTEALPEVPETKVDVVTGGTFVVGEGTYGLEVLLEDELHRNCRGSWQLQARRWGSERQLSATTSPGAVEELAESGTRTVDAKPGPRIGRLTILVHASPLSPNRSALQPDDIQRLEDSVVSLLRELPARSVRLIAFNLDQRAIIFRKDEFVPGETDELTAALRQLELGLVDYRDPAGPAVADGSSAGAGTGGTPGPEAGGRANRAGSADTNARRRPGGCAGQTAGGGSSYLRSPFRVRAAHASRPRTEFPSGHG